MYSERYREKRGNAAMNVLIAVVVLLLIFQIIGELTRCVDMEPTHLYQCYFDEAQNEFILRRGILTIVAADGKVF